MQAIQIQPVKYLLNNPLPLPIGQIMNYTTSGNSLLLEVSEHSPIKAFRFREIRMRQQSSTIGVTLAYMLCRQTYGNRPGILEILPPIHDFMHMQGIIFDIGGNTPQAAVTQGVPDLTSQLILHNPALMVLHLWPWIRKERPHFGHDALRHMVK
ncbi:hypothetical protein BITS_1691 [Bifidobacterium tsurumiense]|uniref:Uncharacterized protein n=1 Tax=Bifidobacterium tsurumiense TaxID=356829 RepID=A0A087EBJ2_9BIFI|nr:hypothetical protein BITS_1691 [Bifidobacterium tsurumiense]